MIKTYGIEARAERPGFGRVVKRAEIPAGSAAEAQGYMRGWCIVQGYDVDRATFTAVTDGMTFREHMTRELSNAGARLSLRHGVAVIGPIEREPQYQGDPPRSVMRLELPNGWAVSLLSRLSDTFSVDTEMVTGYDDGDDDWCTDFTPGVMEYESRIMIDEDGDEAISEVIEGLAKLPPRR